METEHGVKYEKSVGNCSFTSQMTISATSLRVGLIKSDGIFVEGNLTAMDEQPIYRTCKNY